MLFSWVVLASELIENQHRRRGEMDWQHPLADPLERPEWRGLHWTIGEHRRRATARRRIEREGEDDRASDARCDTARTAGSLCLSGGRVAANLGL